MSSTFNIQKLKTMGALVAILGIDGYALPVRFRICESIVECRVPTWCGVADLLEKKGEVTLVAVQNFDPTLQWIFLRGQGTLIKDPDWDGLISLTSSRMDPSDMYELLRIVPKRMELFDEQHGWGYRETADL